MSDSIQDGRLGVDELGVTSAPLKSAAFFINAQCQDVNEDFFLCKQENADPRHCAREGRRVTRCAADLFKNINEKCLEEFNAHWRCLENRNQYNWPCRKQERVFNSCVFEKLGLEKKNVPGAPEGQDPVWLKKNPFFK